MSGSPNITMDLNTAHQQNAMFVTKLGCHQYKGDDDQVLSCMRQAPPGEEEEEEEEEEQNEGGREGGLVATSCRSPPPPPLLTTFLFLPLLSSLNDKNWWRGFNPIPLVHPESLDSH